MKAFTKKFLSLAISALTLTNTASISAYADVTRGLSEEEILNSSVKPVMTVTKELLQPDSGVSSKKMNISVSLSGADGKYASTGIHLFYDSRLTPERDSHGKIIIKKGDAAENLNMLSGNDDTKESEGMNGLFVATSSNSDSGMDGEFFSFDVTLPTDAKNGDVFPIDIVYMEYAHATDIFIDVYKKNIPMQVYLFTKGIYNSENPISNSAEYLRDMKNCSALTYIDPSCDGYIAVADSHFEETYIPYLVPSKITMQQGDTSNIIVVNQNGKKIEWTSSNTSVVTVRNGAVTAVNEGNAIVYAVCGDNVMQCEINVINNSSYLAGDANLDRKVSISDAVRILQYIANNNKYPLSSQAAKNADVYGNNDGVTANDAAAIQRYDAGVTLTLPEQ